MYQASYSGPDIARHNAPATFTNKVDAEAWLAMERRLIEWDEWMPPAQRRARQLHDDTQMWESRFERCRSGAGGLSEWISVSG